jgi:hypothetical protein
LICHPLPNGVVAAGKPMRKMRMKAFHATTSAANSATWLWAGVVGWHQCVALCFVPLMNGIYGI